MKRRALLAGLGSLLIASPARAHAQRSRFHVFPSTQPSYACYQRDRPLFVDTAEFDANGDMDWANHAFQNKGAAVKGMHFTFNMLWQNAQTYGYVTPLLFRSVDNGASWQEIAGTDFVVNDYPGVTHNQGNTISRDYEVQPGEMVRAHPCFAWVGTAMLANASNGGRSTCNYFSGFEI